MDLLNYLRSKNIFIDKGFVKRSFYWTTFCKQLLTTPPLAQVKSFVYLLWRMSNPHAWGM